MVEQIGPSTRNPIECHSIGCVLCITTSNPYISNTDAMIEKKKLHIVSSKRISIVAVNSKHNITLHWAWNDTIANGRSTLCINHREKTLSRIQIAISSTTRLRRIRWSSLSVSQVHDDSLVSKILRTLHVSNLIDDEHPSSNWPCHFNTDTASLCAHSSAIGFIETSRVVVAKRPSRHLVLIVVEAMIKVLRCGDYETFPHKRGSK